MIFAERIHLTIPGIVCGVLLGTVYGWAGVLTAISSDRFIGQNLWFSSQGGNVPGSLSGPRCGRASLRSSRRVASGEHRFAPLVTSGDPDLPGTERDTRREPGADDDSRLSSLVRGSHSSDTLETSSLASLDGSISPH